MEKVELLRKLSRLNEIVAEAKEIIRVLSRDWSLASIEPSDVRCLIYKGIAIKRNEQINKKPVFLT